QPLRTPARFLPRGGAVAATRDSRRSIMRTRSPTPPLGLLPRASRPRRNQGLSLVELLISLAISVMLLTAVAAAFHSTTTAVEVNDRFFRASQTARIAATQMSAAVRQSDSCQVGTTDQQNGDAVTGAASLDIITPTGRMYSYVYAAD